MRVQAAWMGVGLWCFGSTEIPTEIGYGIGIGISGACMYSNVRRRSHYADIAVVMFMKPIQCLLCLLRLTLSLWRSNWRLHNILAVEIWMTTAQVVFDSISISDDHVWDEISRLLHFTLHF